MIREKIFRLHRHKSSSSYSSAGTDASAQKFDFTFSNIQANQDTRTGKIVGRGTEHRGLYYVDGIAQKGAAMLTQGLTKEQTWLWHRRLGHPSIGYLRLIYPNLDISHPLNCESCFLAKSHRHSFKPNNTRVRSVFSLIHSDVWGPAPVTSDNGFRYFLLFVDDCSRMTWVYFLKSKNEVFEKFTHFYNLVQTQYKKSIQILRSDNGGEYVNSKMQNFFTEKGLVHQTTCPYTPKQNEVVERKNRIILEMTRALIIDSQVPKSYWPEAVATSVYLLNRLPTHALHFKPPLEFLATHSEIPSSLTLKPKVFGCTVYVHIPKQNRTKFSPNTVKCVFLGYGKNQKGYRCYDPVANHLHTTLNCDFVETEYFFHQQGSQGEKQVIVDSLSWLHTPSTIQTTLPLPSHMGETSSASLPGSVPDVGPTEKVSAPAETSTTQVKFKMSSDSIPLSTPSSNPEVSNLNSSQVNTNVEEQRDGDTDTETGGDTKKDGERTELAGATDQYTLPPRSTRGKPPKRYSPDWQGRKTRTKHVDKLSIGNAVT